MWLFEITAGKMYDNAGKVLGKCYAGGNLGTVPVAVDNPAYEGQKDVGPLPEGWYTLGQFLQDTHLGPTAIALVPDPTNDMRGRGGFYIHWNKGPAPGQQTPAINASEGCIVMIDGTQIQTIWNSNDHRLLVVARIGQPPVSPGPAPAPAPR